MRDTKNTTETRTEGSKTMGRNETAKELRGAYKAKGWNSRMIGVRAKPCTYSGSIDVTIKDASVPYATAKEMARTLMASVSNARRPVAVQALA